MRLARVDDGDGRGGRVAVGFGELGVQRGRDWRRPAPLRRSRRRADAARVPPRKRAISSRALRGREADALQRPIAPGAPAARARGPGARRAWSSTSAWISSTITVSTERSRSRAFEVSSRIQRLGRGDQDVGGIPREARAFVRRRVAGADRRSPARGRARPAPRPRARCRRAAPAGCARRRRPGP